jgi:hypothetical protein
LFLQSERKLFLGGREVTLAQQYAAVAVCSVPLFLLAGAGNVMNPDIIKYSRAPRPVS